MIMIVLCHGMKTSFIFSIIAVLPSAFGLPDPRNFFTNTSICPGRDYPWMAVIMLDKEFLGSGVIISSYLIMTATNSFYTNGEKRELNVNSYVVAGTCLNHPPFEDMHQKRDIEGWGTHTEYDPVKKINNVAYVRLQWELLLRPTVACLPRQSFYDIADLMRNFSNKLTNFKVVGHCKQSDIQTEKIVRYRTNDGNVICDVVHKKPTCEFVPGTPVVSNNILVGLIMEPHEGPYSYRIEEPHMFQVYTTVMKNLSDPQKATAKKKKKKTNFLRWI